jgi:UDP-2-acetamido-3-amino-2,3-dideoxy-glucuronate N-acetyltransferase
VAGTLGKLDWIRAARTADVQVCSTHRDTVDTTLVKYGASIGAGAIIICGITIGEFALVGSGSVVTRAVSPHALVFGNPARQHGYVCRCARRLTDVFEQNGLLIGRCERCGKIEFSSAHQIPGK